MKLQFSLSTQLSITPQLRKAIQLLRLSSLELEMEVQSILESNLLLEHPEDFTHFSQRREPIDSLPIQSPEPTLKDHLNWQVMLSHFSSQERDIAMIIIDATSEEGYLLSSLNDIQSQLNTNVSVETIESVLKKIQHFEPVGVCARTLSECLSIQIKHLPPGTPLRSETLYLVEHHLPDLKNKSLNTLKKTTGFDEATLSQAIKLLKTLNPKPGNSLSTIEPHYITPDVIATIKDDIVSITLNQERVPKLRLNTHYMKLLENTSNEHDQQIFKTHFKEAQWFLKGLQNRYETLLKVSQAILNYQKDFLLYGEHKMKPLSLQDIAQTVGVHESTVSRITTQKYVLTPRGVFELKYFFTHSASSSQTNPDISALAIRTIIKELILKESSQTPLSDHKLTELLEKKGISIARRTVSKYREAIGIPTANERKHSGYLR